MKFIKKFILDKIRLVQILLLFSFVFTGVSITKDYGISYDELEYRQQGFVVLNYVGEKLFQKKQKKSLKIEILIFQRSMITWGGAEQF